MLRRRTLLKAALSALMMLAAGIRGRLGAAASDGVFRHGVASGDPTRDGVILWTRVSVNGARPVPVRWRVATDSGMQHIVKSGHARAEAARDFTVKVDVAGLASGSEYFYQFSLDGDHSQVGRTRTLPTDDPDEIRLAVVSCANHPAGFFNVYREIANRPDLHAVVHLGDYIYEYGRGGYASDDAEALGRVPEPATDLGTLGDYRRRHAQYKRDPDSQAMLASLPLIAVWDDHEIANDAWRSGAENHDDGKGDWARRRDAAVRAYFEWMPIRGEPRGGSTRIFREFRFGSLASLIMLDTRLYGRDRQPDAGSDNGAEAVRLALKSRKRRLLGRRQERWLRRRLEAGASATWQLIGQQVLMSRLVTPDLTPLVDTDAKSTLSRESLLRVVDRSRSNPPAVLDTWDGYPAAREDLYADLGAIAPNPVVLSGDLHTALAADLIPEGAERAVAVEFMTGAVSSPPMTAVLPERQPGALKEATLRQNPWLKYLDVSHRGWLCLIVTPRRCTGEWHLIDTVTSREYRSWRDRILWVDAGRIGDGLKG